MRISDWSSDVCSSDLGAFAGVTAKLRPHVALPLVATNRINMPDVAERILASGGADMVSMARPLLADPWWVAKARIGKAHEINTCITCTQACLDHVFQNRRASRSEEHTSELQSLMSITYAVICLKKKNKKTK